MGGGAVTYYEYCARAEIDLAQVKPIKIIKHINCQPKCLLSNFRPGANHIRVAPIKFVYCQQALTVPDGWGGLARGRTLNALAFLWPAWQKQPPDGIGLRLSQTQTAFWACNSNSPSQFLGPPPTIIQSVSQSVRGLLLSVTAPLVGFLM